MNDYLWANPVGRIRFIEKTLLTRSDLMRVLEAPTLESAQSALRDSYYGPYVSKLDNSNDFEPALEAAMKGIYEGILEIAPEPIIIDAYRARYDFHNLKVILKAEVLDVAPDDSAFSQLGNFDLVALDNLIAQARKEDDATLRAKKKKRLQTDDPREKSLYAIGLEIEEVYRDIRNVSLTRSLSPFEVDSHIDKSYYSWIGNLYRRHGYYFLIEFIQREIDILNMKMLMRSYRLKISPDDFAKAVLEGGTIKSDLLVSAFAQGPKGVYAVYQGSELEKLAGRGLSFVEKNEPLTRWEKDCDDAISEIVKEAGKVALGPEPVFGYVFGREIETKNLRIIFSGKQSSVPESKIRAVSYTHLDVYKRQICRVPFFTGHFFQPAGYFSQRFSPTRCRICHKGNIITHVSIVLSQSNSGVNRGFTGCYRHIRRIGYQHGPFHKGSARTWIQKLREFKQDVGHLIAAFTATYINYYVRICPFGQLVLNYGLSASKRTGHTCCSSFCYREKRIDYSLACNQLFHRRKFLLYRSRETNRPLLKHRNFLWSFLSF